MLSVNLGSAETQPWSGPWCGQGLANGERLVFGACGSRGHKAEVSGGGTLLRLLGVPDKLTPRPKDLVTGSPQLSRGRRSRLSDRVRHFPKATQPVIASPRFKL